MKKLIFLKPESANPQHVPVESLLQGDPAIIGQLRWFSGA
jgi:hypothetical protein